MRCLVDRRFIHWIDGRRCLRRRELFVEAAFPITFSFTKDTAGANRTNGELDIVFHTGIGV